MSASGSLSLRASRQSLAAGVSRIEGGPEGRSLGALYHNSNHQLQNRLNRVELEYHGHILDRHLADTKLVRKTSGLDKTDFVVKRPGRCAMREDPEVKPGKTGTTRKCNRLLEQPFPNTLPVICRLDSQTYIPI